MPWQVTPLHVSEAAIALPLVGAISVGRRPANGIICRDLAVSGQHCVFHCRGGSGTQGPEIEDSSTNGTYVNEMKLTRGQRQTLTVGDVVSLTKPLDEIAGQTSVRVQYRLDFLSDDVALASLGGRAAADGTIASVIEIPATAPERRPPSPDAGAAAAAAASTAAALGATPLAGGTAAGANASGGERNFAQDLLVQEQQSKAKITGELLLSQRKLEEERSAAEALNREVRKIRQMVEEERARRHEVEEGRDRLTSEVDALRAERRQLQELQAAHEELRRRYEGADAELQSRLRRCVQLEAGQEQLRFEVERATESHRKASQQHAELQTRARQAQDRAERLEQQHAEAQRDIGRASEEAERLRQEVQQERQSRQALEQQVEEIQAQVEQASAEERLAREALDAATARRAELECQASTAQTDAEAAKAAARQAQQKLDTSGRVAEQLRESGRNFSQELRRRAEAWEKALEAGTVEALSAVLGVQEAATVQVTCNVEGATPIASPAREPHEPDGAARSATTEPRDTRDTRDGGDVGGAGATAAVQGPTGTTVVVGSGSGALADAQAENEEPAAISAGAGDDAKSRKRAAAEMEASPCQDGQQHGSGSHSEAAKRPRTAGDGGADSLPAAQESPADSARDGAEVAAEASAAAGAGSVGGAQAARGDAMRGSSAQVEEKKKVEAVDVESLIEPADSLLAEFSREPQAAGSAAAAGGDSRFRGAGPQLSSASETALDASRMQAACSTAWSLEVLDMDDLRSLAPAPGSKRLRLD